MKTTILGLAAATALTAGAASAQPYGYGRDWMPIERRMERIDFRIDQGVRSGQLTSREAYRLRDQFNRLVRLEARYSRNGLSNWERADLNRRFDALSMNVREARRDRDRRYGYNDYPRY
ncbi:MULTISPECIES: hypothetical protein [unclassified Phenylobacterium]|uniref:hypothetical protein n=1 Tax=unclassified Phenylobacterium TaxID=2640670 RepID=UPI00083A03E8|nr:MULTISPECIES: hypothetical protein [unclassified Phenylobacterium]